MLKKIVHIKSWIWHVKLDAAIDSVPTSSTIKRDISSHKNARPLRRALFACKIRADMATVWAELQKYTIRPQGKFSSASGGELDI
jgi:hypothetical protein